MDVKYINPFLLGTSDVMIKMSSLMVTAGKPYAKKTDVAPGDVSGIIGITGDAVGSLAISFTEGCICSIVTGILGELQMEVNQVVIDAVGELTNMISGAARSRLEKEGMILHAAIPTVIYGKGHTVRHILHSPSIVIPFQTEGGTFYVDVCLKAEAKQKAARPSASASPLHQPSRTIAAFQRPSVTTLYSAEARKSPVHAPAQPAAKPAAAQPEEPKEAAPAQDPAARQETAPGQAEAEQAPKTPEEKIAALKKAMENAALKREEASGALKKNPFMPLQERKKYNKIIDSCDAAIKRLKLDIAAVRMIAEIKDGEMTIKTHYQHYDNKNKKP